MSGRIGAALLVGCAVLGACASEADEPLLGQSSTPRITVGEAPDEVEAVLLAESDVRAIDGFESAEASDLADNELYEDPDPRGPCGLRVDPPPNPDAGRVFSTEDAIVVELVWADGQAMEGAVEVDEGDLRPGCGSFESTTNVGTTQEVSEPVPIDTTGIGDRAVGWTSTITSSGVTTEDGVVLLLSGERAMAVLQIGGDVDGERLADIARAAAAQVGD